MLIFTCELYVPIVMFMYFDWVNIDYVAIGTIVTVLSLVIVGAILDYRNARKQDKI